MDSTTYSTGSWLGIVRSGSVIVLEGRTNPAIVHELWDYLGQEPTIHGVLNEVTEKFGTGLTGMPHFAILVQRERLHVILRGDIALVAHIGDATESVSGRDVTTWSERSLPLADALELTLAEPDGDVETFVLPLGEGVVRLQSLSVVAGSLEQDSDQPDDGAVPDGVVPVAALSMGEHDSSDDGWGARPGADSANTLYSGEPEFSGKPEFATASELDAVVDPAVVQESAADINPAHDQELGADGEAAEEIDPMAEAEALASFAKAAEAADAEWIAQLAPLDVAGDLNQTIHPGTHDQDLGAEDDAVDHTAGGHSADSHSASDSASDEGADGAQLEGPAEEQHAAQGFATPAGGGAAGEPEPGDDGFTINYDYLFGATTMGQSVEAAAVRLDEDGQPIPPSDQALPPLPLLPPGAGNAGLDQAASADAAAGHNQEHLRAQPTAGFADSAEAADQAAAVQAAPDQAPANQTPANQTPGATGQGSQEPAAHDDSAQGNLAQGSAQQAMLIDSVPWGPPAVPDANTPTGQTPQAATFGATISGTDAPGTDASGAGDSEAFSDGAYDPDHDGQTVMRGDVATGGQPVAEPLESRPPTGPMVLARMCPNGHANPPSRSQCSDCGSPISSEPREVGRPRLGTMHISSGEVVELDHSLIIGRQPSVSRVMGAAMPRLVQVKSSNGDISRSHVEVRLDGWDVLLVDLKATNGTVLVREGQQPRRLSQGEEAILLNGDIAELGDGVSLLFDGLV